MQVYSLLCRYAGISPVGDVMEADRSLRRYSTSNRTLAAMNRQGRMLQHPCLLPTSADVKGRQGSLQRYTRQGFSTTASYSCSGVDGGPAQHVEWDGKEGMHGRLAAHAAGSSSRWGSA